METPETPLTKWSVLQERLDHLMQQADIIRREMKWMKQTTFGMPCSGCGEMLETEADFAQHFVLDSRAYLNVGECPGPKRPKVQQMDAVSAYPKMAANSMYGQRPLMPAKGPESHAEAQTGLTPTGWTRKLETAGSDEMKPLTTDLRTGDQ